MNKWIIVEFLFLIYKSIKFINFVSKEKIIYDLLRFIKLIFFEFYKIMLKIWFEIIRI